MNGHDFLMNGHDFHQKKKIGDSISFLPAELCCDKDFIAIIMLINLPYIYPPN